MNPLEFTPSRATAGVAGWLVACLVSLFCPTVWADDVDEAQRHFERAVRLYQERAYDGALAEFQRAHELSPHFQVLFNMGQVHYQLNEYAEALRAFERYLREGGDQVTAERQRYVQGELAELRERVGTLVVQSEPSGASVLLDDTDVGPTPLAPLTVDVGRHVLRVELPGHRSVVRKLHIASGEVARVELSLEPSELEPSLAVAERGPVHDAGSRGRRAALWTLGSLALALTASAGASFAIAYAADHDLDERLRELPPDTQAVEADRTRVRRAALASDVLGIGALATASAFVITLIATRPPREARVRARQGTRTLALHLEAGPSRLGLRGTF